MSFEITSRLYDLDLALTESAARLFGHSVAFDGVVRCLLQLDTSKIFPIVALLCVVASRQANRSEAVRVLLDGIAAGLLALVAARIVQNLGPLRPRPAFVPGFDAPLPLRGRIPPDWSSFPSDTAALAFALALVVLRSSRMLGILALLWASLISLARLIGAFHYPTDLLAGAAIGALAVLPVFNSFVKRQEERLIERVLTSAPTLACLFLVGMLFQLSTMFYDVRHGAGELLQHIGVLKEQPKAQVTVVNDERLPSQDS